jgi:hypothetical protein
MAFAAAAFITVAPVPVAHTAGSSSPGGVVYVIQATTPESDCPWNADEIY